MPPACCCCGSPCSWYSCWPWLRNTLPRTAVLSWSAGVPSLKVGGLRRCASAACRGEVYRSISFVVADRAVLGGARQTQRERTGAGLSSVRSSCLEVGAILIASVLLMRLMQRIRYRRPSMIVCAHSPTCSWCRSSKSRRFFDIDRSVCRTRPWLAAFWQHEASWGWGGKPPCNRAAGGDPRSGWRRKRCAGEAGTPPHSASPCPAWSDERRWLHGAPPTTAPAVTGPKVVGSGATRLPCLL
jgi:hypothetical protein